MKIDYPFGNHMVLQHHKKIKITGKSLKKEITILFLNQEYYCHVNQGYWSIEMFLKEIGGPYTMIIKEDDSQIIWDDIYIGDVFLAAGQSNMEFKTKQLREYKDIQISNKTICYLNVPQVYYNQDQEIYPEVIETSWQRLNNNNVGELSAVAYYFASFLDIDIPIGIISNNKGGTSASCWISENKLKEDDSISFYYDSYYKDIENISKSQQKENYLSYVKKCQDYQKEYDHYCQQYPHLKSEEIKDMIGHTPWPPPKSYFDFLRPCGLYSTMFLKTIHYPISAILWYQGEEDAINGKVYDKLLMKLIDNWRNDYHEEIPFYVIQLPEYLSPIEKGFSYIRFAQKKVTEIMDKVYLIVTLGAGNPRNIHPENKKEVGYRLALSVMKHHYHQDKQLFPKIIEDEHDNNIILICNQELQEGKVILEGIDEDLKRQSLEASIYKNKIIIPSCSLKTIIYGDHNVPKIQIKNKSGLPMSPFQWDIRKEK